MTIQEPSYIAQSGTELDHGELANWLTVRKNDAHKKADKRVRLPSSVRGG